MTVFITRCWPAKPERCSRPATWTLGWLLVLLAVCLGGDARAQNATEAELLDLRLQRSEGQWLLSAQTRLELGGAVEEALLKGVAVHFVAQVEAVRERWYWTDRTVLRASRHFRLAYLPLTRKWRLNMAAEPLSSSTLAASLSQTFDTLAEALAPMRRLAGWKIAEAQKLQPGTRYTIDYRFWLDVQQLPRPFQFGAGAQGDWNLSVGRKFRLEPAAPGA